MTTAKASFFFLAAGVGLSAAAGNAVPVALGAEAGGFSLKASIHLDDATLPNPVLTPGDVLTKAKVRDLCGDAKPLQQLPSDALCAGAFADYGIKPEYRFQYKCSFLVPVEIGGASTPRNVWPQPVQEAVAKGLLDRDVQKRVCNEEVTPAQAQTDIAIDWVQAYRLYLLPGDPAPVYVEPAGGDAGSGTAGPSLAPQTVPPGDLQGAGAVGPDESRPPNRQPRPAPGNRAMDDAPLATSPRGNAVIGQPVNGANLQPRGNLGPIPRRTMATTPRAGLSRRSKAAEP